MYASKLVIAAFVALVQYVSAAPIDVEARLYRQPMPIISGNDKNTFVFGSATGGNGGDNTAYNVGYAVPIVKTGSGKVFTAAQQANGVQQSADGGGAIVAGKYTVRDLEARGYTFVPIIKDNDKNTIVVGQATGGDGGHNSVSNTGIAAPFVFANGGWGSKVTTTAAQQNAVAQSANGGGAVVAGKYARDLDDRGYTFPSFKNNDKNVIVLGQATGGNGGSNSATNFGFATPVVISGGGRGSMVDTSAAQQNVVQQSANGGNAVVAGKYSTRDLDDEEELEARGFAFPTFYNNDKNVVVVGSATGGNGGTNSAYNYGAATPIVFTGGKGGKVITQAQQENVVYQSANGGSAAVIGKSSKRDDDDLEARTYRSGPLIAVGPVLSDNDGNTLVKGEAMGGNGGTNKATNVGAAIPIVVAPFGNKVWTSAAQQNAVEQSANGGGAAVIGNKGH